MSFGAELKDFTAGFQTGFSMRDKSKARKQQTDLYNAKTRGMTTDDTEAFDKTKFGEGAGGKTTVRPPKASTDTPGGGGSYDTGDASANNVLAFIRQREAGTKDPYNTVLGGGTADLSNMTIADVQKYQRNMIDQGKESSAVGAYQFIMPTLDATVKQLGLDPATTKFTPEVQDKLGYQLLKNRGWGNPKVGRDALMHNLSQEWASLPKDASGKSFYEGTGSNHSGSTWDQFAKAFDAPTTNPVKATAIATAPGVTPASAIPTTAPAEADAAQPEVQPVEWDINGTGDDEENPEGYAEGGPVGGMRVFTQAVPQDAGQTSVSQPAWQPRRVGQAPSTPTSAIPVAGQGAAARFHDAMAASRARLAAGNSQSNTAPDPGAFGPQAYASYLQDWHTKNKERPYSAAYVSHGMGGMNHGQPVDTINMPAKQAITAPTYGQWMASQPGYSDWVKAYQKPGAPAAAGFAEGGPVRRAIPAGQLVASKDYGQLDPGGAPLNEGTAAQWRIDAAAQKRAQQRLQKRDQEYHKPTPAKATPASKVATPPRRPKKGDGPDETGAVPPEAATEAYPGSRAPATPPPGTPGAGKPGELGTPNAVTPDKAIPLSTVSDAMGGVAPGTEPEYAPYGDATSGDNSATEAYPGSAEPRPERRLDRAGITPGVAPPAPPPPGSTSTTGAYPGSGAPPAAAIDTRDVELDAAPRIHNPQNPTLAVVSPTPQPYVAGAIPAGPATPADQPPLIRRTDQPPIPPRAPNPQVAQAIPAGPATPADQPPLLRRTDQPPIPPRPVQGQGPQPIPSEGATPAEQPPLLRRADQPPASAAQADISPEPWIPQNVPEQAQGTLSQAWQYGRALVNGPPEKRGEATQLFNDTLIRAMKLGTPHSVISAYADNFGTIAPGRPKQAIGFAAGGPVPALPGDEYTPANQVAAANDQPVIPEGGANLRAATPEAEVKAKGLVSKDEARESTHAGLKYINDNILSPSPTRAVGADPAQGSAQQKFDTNDHALTSQEVATLGQQVDPENKLSQGDKILKMQSDMYDFYMAHGYPEKAAGAAASVLMYGRRVSQMSGTMAQAALESGRPDALDQATKFLVKAYETMPNGQELRATPAQNGKVTWQVLDSDGNEVNSGVAGPAEIMDMAKKMSSGAAWARETIDTATGAGVGVGGTKGGKHGPTYTERSSEERKGLAKAAADAGKAFKADPSDANRQAYEDAKAAAVSGGVSGGAVTSLDKIYNPTQKTPGTAGERDDAASDARLKTTLGDLDKQIQAAPDDAARKPLLQQKALTTLDDGYERAVRKTKTTVNTKGLSDDLDAMETPPSPEDKTALMRLAPDFMKANRYAAHDAGAILMQAMDPATPIKLNGNQVMIGDSPYFMSGAMFKAIKGIQKFKRDQAQPKAA